VSEGDFSDVSYSDFSEPEEVKPKKNRPGQRARQKKWETLYGEQANHVAKRKAEEKPKKIWPKKQKMEESQPKKPKVEKIHPSWAAKKQQAISVTDFKGTKVTFDSDNE
jgi:outer membrane protein OmpA-like peptidoglycan-associated protein